MGITDKNNNNITLTEPMSLWSLVSEGTTLYGNG